MKNRESTEKTTPNKKNSFGELKTFFSDLKRVFQNDDIKLCSYVDYV